MTAYNCLEPATLRPLTALWPAVHPVFAEVVTLFVQLMRDGCAFPPVRIRLDPRTSTFQVTDGSHRTAASLQLGFTHVPCRLTVPVVNPQWTSIT
jgi:hypothetical protein